MASVLDGALVCASIAARLSADRTVSRTISRTGLPHQVLSKDPLTPGDLSQKLVSRSLVVIFTATTVINENVSFVGQEENNRDSIQIRLPTIHLEEGRPQLEACEAPQTIV